MHPILYSPRSACPLRLWLSHAQFEDVGFVDTHLKQGFGEDPFDPCISCLTTIVEVIRSGPTEYLARKPKPGKRCTPNEEANEGRKYGSWESEVCQGDFRVSKEQLTVTPWSLIRRALIVIINHFLLKFLVFFKIELNV